MKNRIVKLIIAVAGATLLIGCGNSASKESTAVSAEIETETETESLSTEEVTEEATEIEEAVAEPETEAPVIAQTTLFAQKTANVRQTPDTNSAILGTLSVNDPVIVNGDMSADGWYMVTYCDQTAYVKGDLLGTEQVAVTNTTSSTGNGKSSSGKGKTGVNESSSNEASSSGSGAENTASGNEQTATPAQEQPAAQTPSEQPAASVQNEQVAAPAEQPAQPEAGGDMAGANATMSEALGQSGHWENTVGPDGVPAMMWVTD